uniref:T9SS type A sorting domain-containing protein n=1 Tax=candidate division WOR-3 bacterium TaxID=2052148 RepID=A0A7C6A8Y3_UNCW3
MVKNRKIFLSIMLLVAIGFSTPPPAIPMLNFTVEPNSNFSTTIEYDWELTKTANPTEIEFYPFASPPQIGPELITFTIDVNKIEPSEIQVTGNLYLKMHGDNLPAGSPFTLTKLIDKICIYNDVYPGNNWSTTIVLFAGSFPAVCSTDYYLGPYNLNFTLPYELCNDSFQHTFYWEYTYANVNYTGETNPFTPSANKLRLNRTYLNNSLTVTDAITVPEGFIWDWNYSGAWITASSQTFTISLNLSRGTAEIGGHKIINTANGTSDNINRSDFAEVFIDVIKPVAWEGFTYTPGYWKNHQPQTTSLLSNINWFGTTLTWQQAYSILSNPSAKNPWNSFCCHFLATLLNVAADPTLSSAYYNVQGISNEYMENQAVSTIITAGYGYNASMPRATILQMKDVFDNINNNQSIHCLWTGPMSFKTFSLPSSNSIALHPNVFSDRTEIHFRNEMKEPAKVSIYDLTGKKVRDLTGTDNSIVWDGKDNNGKKLGHGVYIIRLENSIERSTIKALICR